MAIDPYCRQRINPECCKKKNRKHVVGRPEASDQ